MIKGNNADFSGDDVTKIGANHHSPLRFGKQFLLCFVVLDNQLQGGSISLLYQNFASVYHFVSQFVGVMSDGYQLDLLVVLDFVFLRQQLNGFGYARLVVDTDGET